MCAVTCKYKNCRHESRDIVEDEAVKSGDSYYHKDCSKEKDEIREIIDLFVKHVNPHPVYTQLQSIIKNIVITKNLGSNFLLFALKYYIQNKIPLNYPQGLYYVIQNKKVIESYSKNQVKIAGDFTIEEVTESTFDYTPRKTCGFQDIIKG